MNRPQLRTEHKIILFWITMLVTSTTVTITVTVYPVYASPDTENLTGYTEVDDDSKLSANATSIK